MQRLLFLRAVAQKFPGDALQSLVGYAIINKNYVGRDADAAI